MSTDSIEKLYKNFGILADAKDKLAEVSNGLVISNHANEINIFILSKHLWIDVMNVFVDIFFQ